MKCFVAIALVALFAVAYGLPSAKPAEPENIEPLEEEKLSAIPAPEDAPRDKRGLLYTAPLAYSAYSAFPAYSAYRLPYTYTYRTYPYAYSYYG